MFRPSRSAFHSISIALLVFLAAPLARAQASPVVVDTLNRVDEMGRKQGLWRIVAPKEDKPGYTDGQVIEEGTYSNGKRSGLWRRYWPNGKVMSEITYQMGRPRGEYKIYYPSGKTEEQGSWDLDRNIGGFKRYHTNGKLAQDFVFDAYGTRDGMQRYYHENSQLAVEVNVAKGQEDSTLKRYYANGDLQQTAVFDGGVINEANSKYIKPVHRDTAPVAAPTGKPAPAVATDERPNALVFRENGFNTLYDRQLRLSQVGEFKEGHLYQGKYYRYDKNGKLVRIEMYQNGRYAGDGVITDEDMQ